MTPATRVKRTELLAFIERVLASEPAVQGVVGVGSIATGLMQADSDIDAVVFLDPMDWYVVPAEFIWLPSDGTFHSIFSEDEAVQKDGISFDFSRLELGQWGNPTFLWPESRRAELYSGWMAYDRYGKIAEMIAQRTAYPESLRQSRLDEAIIWLDQHLGTATPKSTSPEARWERLGPAIAHDRLQAAFGYLAQALFAYNWRWQPWRNRRMEALQTLPWTPEPFEEQILTLVTAPGHDLASYLERVRLLRLIFQALLDRLIADGIYSTTPIDEAFIRAHDEPGYAWNMEKWNAARLARALQNSEPF